MRRWIPLFLFFLFAFSTVTFSQFGRNKIQYKGNTWYYIQTKHFDIYFDAEGVKGAEFACKASEDALAKIQKSMQYNINNRISIILYNSQNEFQETNVLDESVGQGTGGFTELFKNRVVLPFTGSYKLFRHVIHHELVHAVINDMYFGGSIQNIISSSLSLRLPLWFNEGLAEYLSLGWDTNTDMFIRDAAINEYLPTIEQLDGYFAYRGGQAVFNYIAKVYGEEKIPEILKNVRSKQNFEAGIKASIGLTIEELNERWRKDIKRNFWPDIADRKDPDEFAKKLTDRKKDEGYYNTSPAISPQGDKIAFVSNRDVFFDVYIMSAIDGKVIKKLVKGNRTVDFEELSLLTPGITWSPDGSKIAIAAKSGSGDAIFVFDVQSGDSKTLEVKLPSITSVSWSPDGEWIAFTAQSIGQSDIYTYNVKTNALVNITNDIFSDADPTWSPDSKSILFSSDRDNYLDAKQIPSNFKMHSHKYEQMDLYSVNISSKVITRITNLEKSDESCPIYSPDGKEIMFLSDINGINNLYKIHVPSVLTDTTIVSSVSKIIPLTNSLNGIYQPSVSSDGKKVAFTSMYSAAYSIFVLVNPFEQKLPNDSVLMTKYAESLYKKTVVLNDEKPKVIENKTGKQDSSKAKESDELSFFTGTVVDSVKIISDSIKIDYNNYVFSEGAAGSEYAPKKRDSLEFAIKDNIDTNGNYKVKKYKVNFSPDMVYANAGYSTYYGLLGTTVLSFSDMLGNHRLIGITSLQIDLKNSDYGLSYYYLANRLDVGIEGFHTARFVYLTRNNNQSLYRFRNYGAVLSFSYPLNRFYRVDAGLSFLNVSSENLDDTITNIKKNTFLIPTISFIHDNTIFGYTAPIDGTRYRLDITANPFIDSDNYSFYSILGDYRVYNRFWYDYSLASRFSFGYSGGNSPQRFFLGGIENWINRQWATGDIPISGPNDFAFLSSALPMRGYNYAEKIGSKYFLTNIELRFPLIRYLVTGGIPLLFSNVMAAAFVDFGAAWNENKDLKLFDKNTEDKLVSKDLLCGMGFGARTYFLYFLLRFDVAWAYNFDSFSKPIFYFSLGTDF